MNWLKRLLGPRYPVLRLMLVNTRTEQCFRGVLWQRRGDYLVLRNAELIKATKEAVPIAGEVVIMADNVDFIVVVD